MELSKQFSVSYNPNMVGVISGEVPLLLYGYYKLEA